MIMKMRPIALIITTLLALLAVPADAKPGKDKGKDNGPGVENPGKGNKNKDKDKPGKGNKGGGSNFEKFGDRESQELNRLFNPENRKNLPPGLQKNLERGKPLPPGWQKKLAAGQVVDAGWLGLMTPVPYDFVPGIRAVPGTRLYHHDDRVIRVNEETRVILDVIRLMSR